MLLVIMKIMMIIIIIMIIITIIITIVIVFNEGAKLANVVLSWALK